MVHVPKNNFNSQLLQREMLSEEQKLVNEAQVWFNKLLKEYLQNTQQKGGIITIHRAILICILNNAQTITLEFALEKRVKMGDEEFNAERFYVKCNGRAYVICIHNEESFAGGIVHFNEKDKYTLSLIGTEELQQEGKKVINKVKRAGFLEAISKKQKISESRHKLLKILQNLDSEAVGNIEKTISRIKKQKGL